MHYASTVVPGFRVLGFRALSGFRAQNPGDGAWLAPLFWPFRPKLV